MHANGLDIWLMYDTQFNDGGPIGYIKVTKDKDDYIEGNYSIRVKVSGIGVRVDGNFQGRLKE